MNLRTSLLGGGAVAAVLLMGIGSAEAKTARHHHVARSADPAKPNETTVLRGEVEELRQQVGAMKAWQDSQVANQQQSEAQLAAMKAQLAETQARADAAQAKVDAQIETIPGVVKKEIVAARPKDDVIHLGFDPDTGKSAVNVSFAGSFLALETVYRSRQEGADIGSTYSGIPLPNVATSHLQENRFTARQSRIAFLAQGDVSSTIHLSGYYEMDFLGAAQSANSNESNSFQPRIRNIYTTVDWDTDFGGVSFLGGQSWSLATLYSKGLSPRSEQVPLTIEAQYVPGFNWARQPGIRLTANLQHTWWFAASLENPQTTFFTSGKYIAGVSPPITTIVGGSEFNSANNLSLNVVPDVIGKVAYDHPIMGHTVHVEAYGIYRDFYDRLSTNGVASNSHNPGGGFGGGIIIGVVPKWLDLQFSGLTGRGIGRYGSGQLPDVSFGVDGTIKPIQEYEIMGGGILHYGKALDVYVYGGEESETSQNYGTGSIINGIGNPNYNNTGCEIEGSTVCVGNTHDLWQITTGFWDRPYTLRFGRFQWGLQYSYTERRAFVGFGPPGTVGDPRARGRENMLFTSVRFYPF
jgi:nucleotide-binding universal stress UspA family protein